MASPPLLEIASLETRVGSRVRLEGRLSLQAGSVTALVGPSGSGKSIFLRALARLDPVARIEASLQGQPLGEYSPPLWRSLVSYLPPTPALWGTRLHEDFGRVLPFHVRQAKRPSPDAAKTLLMRLEAGDLWEQNPSVLSTGERQRAALARILWLSPRVLLLDEPTAALDPHTRSLAANLICEWTGEPRTARATFWITHDLDLAREFCSRFLEVRDGVVREIQKEGLR